MAYLSAEIIFISLAVIVGATIVFKIWFILIHAETKGIFVGSGIFFFLSLVDKIMQMELNKIDFFSNRKLLEFLAYVLDPPIKSNPIKLGISWLYKKL